MATTPEGKVKQKITALLRATPGVWFDMPVPSGYGKSTLDYLGCLRGKFFAIEAKRPGGEPTERQRRMLAEIESAGGTTFVIDGDLTGLVKWIEHVQFFWDMPDHPGDDA